MVSGESSNGGMSPYEWATDNEDQEVDVRFTVPSSTVHSVRLNRAELSALTAAAQFHGMKLTTYIKREALRAASAPLIHIKLR